MSALDALETHMNDVSLAGPDVTEIRIKAHAMCEQLLSMTPEDRDTYTHAFYDAYFECAEPGRVYSIVAAYMHPFLLDLVRSRGQGVFDKGLAASKLIDELYMIRTEESLKAMLTMAHCDAHLMYAIRKFPVAEQGRAIEMLKESGVRPIGLKPLGARFYHPAVVRWMLDGYLVRLENNPRQLAMQAQFNPPPTISASPVLRNMDTVYQLHREGFFDTDELKRWWSSMLRALRPVVDLLAPVDAFFVNQGDPVGLVDSVLSLVAATRDGPR